MGTTVSRNQDIRGIERGNYIDCEYYLRHINDTHIFENNRKRALLNLFRQVMENELSSQQRVCVMLVKVKGISQTATAKQLNVNPSTVYRHLQAAEKKFELAFKHFNAVKRSLLVTD